MKLIKKILALIIFIMVIIGIIYATRHHDSKTDGTQKNQTRLSKQQAIENIINNKEKTNYAFDIKEIKSNNGINIWYKHEPNSPVISMKFFIKNHGKATDPSDKMGRATLASSVIGRGLPNKTFEQIADELNKKNISISFRSNMDDFAGSLTCLDEDMDLASTYINDFLTKATLPDNEIEILKREMRLIIMARDKSASFPSSKKFYEILFKNNDYYNRTMNKASIETIDNINKDDIKEYVSSLNKSKLYVTIVCPLSEKEAKEFVDSCFADLKATNNDNEQTPEIIPVATTNVLERKVPVKANNNQSNVLFYIGSIEKGKEKENIKLSILGKILNKKLFDKVRSEKGLTYHIGTSSGEYRYSNIFLTGYTSVESNNVNDAMQSIRAVISDLVENGVDDITFKKNRNSFINHIYANLKSNNNIASLLNYLLSSNMSKDYLDKREEIALSIDLKEFNDFIKNTIKPNEIFFVYSSPEK